MNLSFCHDCLFQDLHNIAEISNLVHEDQEPIFVTKW